MMILFSTYSSMGQVSKTIYFDQEWNETTKDNASYYRDLPLETNDDLVLIKDYYVSGILQMTGWAEKNNEESFHGEVKWFYENGNAARISNYHYGSLDGIHKEFYENGNEKVKIIYEGQLKEGEASFFNTDGILISTMIYRNDRPYEGTTNCFTTYKEGKNIERKLYYSNTTQLAYEKNTIGDFVKEIYYNKNGTILREIKVDQKLKNQDGFKSSYYPGNSCGYVTEMRHFQNIKNGQLAGDEFFYNPDGSVLYHGINKNNKPYEGTFHKKRRNVTYVSTYKKGMILEEKILFANEVIAKGTYVNGKKYNGTFVSEAEIHGWVCSKISLLKEGKEQGKQIFKRLDDAEPYAYYYAHNGVKDGKNYDYDHNSDTAYILDYKKGIPFEGKLLDENRNILIYKNGELESKKVSVTLRGFNFFDIYKNDKKTGVEYSLFEIDGQTKQIGTYRNNIPYQGYFLRNDFEFPILDYYENGIKKYQYSKGIYKNMKEIDFDWLIVPFKSVYENNKIYTGAQYEQEDSAIITRILEKGEIKAISLWVFAMHYANNIVLKKTSKGIEILEANNPSLKIVVDEESIALMYKKETIHQRKKNANPLINKTDFFYFKKGKLESDVSWGFSRDDMEKMSDRWYDELKSDFLMDIYTKLPSKNTVKSAFEIFGKVYIRKDKGSKYITRISYNEVGKPSEGILIEQKKNGFDVKQYIQNELKESKEIVTIDELKQQIKIWHEKYED